MISPELLRRYTFFNGFTTQDLKELAMAAQEENHAAGDLLFSEGDHADALHFLCDGEVEVLIHAEGENIAISTLPAGEPVGWSALIEPYVFTATARATRPCRVIAFGRSELLKRMENPKFAAVLMRKIAELVSRRLRDTQVQLLSLTAKVP